jgi:hypothetical protein
MLFFPGCIWLTDEELFQGSLVELCYTEGQGTVNLQPNCGVKERMRNRYGNQASFPCESARSGAGSYIG